MVLFCILVAGCLVTGMLALMVWSRLRSLERKITDAMKCVSDNEWQSTTLLRCIKE